MRISPTRQNHMLFEINFANYTFRVLNVNCSMLTKSEQRGCEGRMSRCSPYTDNLLEAHVGFASWPHDFVVHLSLSLSLHNAFFLCGIGPVLFNMTSAYCAHTLVCQVRTISLSACSMPFITSPCDSHIKCGHSHICGHLYNVTVSFDDQNPAMIPRDVCSHIWEWWGLGV